MGCAQSNDGRNSETKTKQIEKNLKDKSLKKNNEVSLLLLGAGESGKTTFLKQMKILNANGYTDAERDQFKPLIHSNVILAMKALVLCLKKQNEIDKIPEEKKKHANYFLDTDELTLVQETLGGEMTNRIKSLWEEEPIKKQQELTRSFDTFENAPHFFDEIDRLSQSNYIPSPDDLLRCRSKTTGINEVVFPLKADVYCRMVDVGGQRSERRKWIYSFNGVDSVLFFVSLSEYDQTLQEDLNCPRLVESKKLFMDICKCKWFVGTPFIIFLNKYDLFCEKIKRVPLKNYYSDYTGGDDVKSGVEFIKSYITECLEPKDREVYIHTTCATDTDNIRKVFNSLRDIFLTRSLKSNGFV